VLKRTVAAKKAAKTNRDSSNSKIMTIRCASLFPPFIKYQRNEKKEEEMGG
jgi:hypothetical protein